MDKSFIIAEIQRTAQENNGSPLSMKRFATETGINVSDWAGKHWAGWGDAQEEAGYRRNVRQGKFDDDWLLGRLALFIQELGHYPVKTEFRMKALKDSTFPDYKTFRRLGPKDVLAHRVVLYCESRGGFEDVAAVSELVAADPATSEKRPEPNPQETFGSIYMLRAGRHYKIGKTSSFARRERELAIQLPEKATTDHVIQTDDPAGIEDYWHRRFAARRKNGEWFELRPADVNAFKRRRKFM